jgi:hypothetical protein
MKRLLLAVLGWVVLTQAHGQTEPAALPVAPLPVLQPIEVPTATQLHDRMNALSDRLIVDDDPRGRALLRGPETNAPARGTVPWVVVAPPAPATVRGASNLVTGTVGAAPGDGP